MLKSTLAAMAAVFAISAFSPRHGGQGRPARTADHFCWQHRVGLNSQKAPISVDNFLKYGTAVSITTDLPPGSQALWCRAAVTEQMQQKQPNPPIKKTKPTMACVIPAAARSPWRVLPTRTARPASSSSTWPITPSLDHGQRDFGPAVFGKVVKGMTSPTKFQVPTHNVGPYQNVPVQTGRYSLGESAAVILFWRGRSACAPLCLCVT